MRKYQLFMALVVALFLVISSAAQTTQTPSTSTQTPNAGAASDRVLGEVTAINSPARQITLTTTAAGKQVVVKIDEKAVLRRVPPGEKSLDKAVGIAFGDISVGDRVIARGAADPQSDVYLARALVVMSKAELTQRRERNRAEWLQRGISGVVTAVNPQTKELTLLSRTAAGNQPVVITLADGARLRRYAPDSVRFSDVTPSSFDELKVGDHVRALGERSADGARYKAEEIISGTVRTIGGTIVSINAGGGEMTVNDIKTQQPLTVVFTRDSLVRRFTPELVKLLERNAASREARTPDTGGASGAGSDIQNMIESLPPITVAELKPGDAIIISSMTGTNPSRVTAVLIATGVEDFLKRQEKLSSRRELNLGLGLPAGAVQ